MSSNLDSQPDSKNSEAEARRKRSIDNDEEISDEETYVEVKKVKSENALADQDIANNDTFQGDNVDSEKTPIDNVIIGPAEEPVMTSPVKESSPSTSPDQKIPSSPGAVPSQQLQGEITVSMEIAPDKVGQIIGSKGAIIQDMQTRSGCKIFVKQDLPPGVNRVILFTGSAIQVKTAKHLVNLILEQGPTALHSLSGPALTQEMDCPQNMVGRIIGQQGATIRDLQARSGAKIQINQDFPEGVPRKIYVSGSAQSIALATQLITQIMENPMINITMQPHSVPVPVPSPANYNQSMGVSMVPPVNSHLQVPSSSPLTHAVMDCAKQFVGRVIGKGGDTINLIQQKSGAKVQIDQNVPEGAPCKVNISGTNHSVALASQFVQEIMTTGPNRIATLPNFLQPNNVYAPAPIPYYDNRNTAPPYMVNNMPSHSYHQYSAPPYNVGLPSTPYQPQQMYVQPYIPNSNPYPQTMYATQGLSSWQQSYGQPVSVPVHESHSLGTASNQTSSSYHTVPAKLQPLPPGWSEHKTDAGLVYWYNANTNTSQWEKPTK